MPEEPRPRVLLADDNPQILGAVEGLLSPSCEIVGLLTAGAAVIEAVIRLRPDVVVLDISMPDVNGLDTCRQIKRVAPKTKVVMLTAFADAEIGKVALSLGASALVLKYAVDDLINAVHAA